MSLQCRVKLLDGSDFLLDLEKKEVGKFVFDQVLRRLSLPEKDKDYFGMEYEDDQKVPQWLDLSKQVKKQMKKPPFTLLFKVKFYPLDPVPHPASRTHFYRQFRRDLIDGKMKCPTHSVSDVVACILQADMGDFESTDQDIEFMTDQRLLIDQSLSNAAVQDEVATLHKLHKGKTPQEAVKTFLRKIRELETYGIKQYDVKYDDSACQLGLSPQGVSLFRRNRRIFVYDWMMVSQISFKAKKFIVMIEKEIGGEMQLVFELDSMKSSKELWSTSRGYAEFYTEPRRRIQEEPDPQTNVRSPGAQGTTTGDHFNFPPPPLPSELNQKDTSKAVDPAQKVKSLPRYLPTSKDPVADALRLNRHKKAHSASPEDATNTSNSTSEAPTSPTDDGGPSRPTEYDRQDQFQYPNSHHHQQFQQHQQQQQQQSHDPNQWSHGQVDEAPLQHYDSLKCRDDYLAHQVQVQQQMQQQQQQMHGEIGAHLAPPPPPSAPRSTTSDLNPAQASRSHSTINPEDLSSQDQDMAGSLLDLADELGEAESPTTGQNRRMVEEHTGTATITTISSTAAQQAMDRNGRFMQESPRTADRQVGYHSYTLPHSFSGGGHAGGGGRSPRARNDGGGGGSDGDSGPPKPPRTDYPPKGGEHHSGSGEMQGNSPYLPGSSFTTGRQHQKKRNLVRNWVQDQQLRTYQSSSSQESGSPANMRHLQQSSPDIRATGGQQNGRLSARSSLGSMGRSPGTSPSHLRSHDTRNRSSDSSPAHRRQSVPSASSHQAAQLNAGQPSIRAHSHSPNQQHAGVSSSIPPPAHQNDVKSDTSPPQEPYRQRMSETVNQMQSDPQVPMLIQEIDELMGGLLDSPVAERKERPSATQNAATSSAFNMLEHSPSTGMNGAGLEQGGGLIASESPFLSNINPADFLRDEEIRIDPRNYLNTPSPEPNLLGTTASAEMAASGGVSTGAFQPSPLVGGVLSTKLQQAMDEEADYHDPPPPPPHLMALTQGFKGDGRLSASRGKKQPPTVSPKPKPQSSVSSTNTGVPQQAESSKTEQKKRPSKEPISQYDPSNLPPEIARFVNRVRHSYDGGDPTQEVQHGRQPSGETAGPRNELPTDRPVDKSAETRVEVSPTYDIPRSSVSPTFDALKVEVAASSHGQIPASVERVTITPEEPRHNTNLSTPQRQNGRPSSAEISPTTGSYSTSAAVYPEAYSPSAGSVKEQDHHSRSTEADSGIGGSAGSGGQQLHVNSGPGGPATSTSAGGMYSYAHYRQSSQDKRDQAMQQQQLHPQQQNKEQQLPPQKGGQDQQMSWDAETQRAKHDVIQAHPQKHQQQQQQHQQQQQQQQQVPHQQYQLRSQPAKNASASLPRGQTLGYGAGPPPQDRLNRGSSDGSSSTTPHAHSDLAIPRTQPRSPTGPAPNSLAYKYQPYTGQQSSNPPRPARGYPPQPPQQQQGYYPPPPQDIRRAQTFSMGQGQPRPTRMAQYRQHPGGEDSLPNSPTYFAQNPPRPNDRGALSPNAMANNRSFQEHLDTLNSTRHGRKMRVLDWMQKQQQQVDGHHMVKDPSAEVPTEPYHKQSHIYASAAEPDPPPPVNVPNPAEQRRPGSAQGGYYQQPQERGRLNTFPYSHSAAHSHPQRPPPQQAPQGMAQRAQVDSRGRGYTNVPPYRPPPTGTHTAPYPQPQPPMGSGGNVGRMAGTPANAQNLPTAKFEKDYYILDV